MRVVVTGATGNVGTSVIEKLVGDPNVVSIVGVARRRPLVAVPKVQWWPADVGTDDLRPIVRGADAVVHLAWMIQPQHDERTLLGTNVIGTNRVLDAVASEHVPAFVYASSVGTYAPGPKETPVDERWPATGIATSVYSRQKAMVERSLDVFAATAPHVRVVRMRTSLVFKRQAASEVARLFLGPLVPRRVLGPRTIRIVPDIDRLAFQATHASDIAEAYRLAVTAPGVEGAFNVAAAPVLDPDVLAEALDARKVRVPARLLRSILWATWRSRLQPSQEGWLDMALGTPIMDTTRIRRELAWTPAWTATDALLDLLTGMREKAGGPTAPLHPDGRGPVEPILTPLAPVSESA